MAYTTLFYALIAIFSLAPSLAYDVDVPPSRPVYSDRTFHSSSVDAYLSSLTSSFTSPKLATLFENTFPNTLDTTVSDPETGFIITGDITAMWLRDACNQVQPYLPFLASDPVLDTLLVNLVTRMASSVTADPYANAFNADSTTPGDHGDDTVTPAFGNAVYESKYELDSLAAFLKLSRGVYEHSPTLFKEGVTPAYTEWLEAVRIAVDSMIAQQQSTDEEMEGGGQAYKFARMTDTSTDTLMQDGNGVPASRTGMSKCAFRGSDDATTFPFHVPANAMAVVELRNGADMIEDIGGSDDLVKQMRDLAKEIDDGINKYGIITHSVTGKRVYAYEVDGFGNSVFMDDANIPGLLSLPYLGYVAEDDEIYINTRDAVLARETNPFYFEGKVGAGVGGPHQGYGKVWPMAITVQALTSTSSSEIKRCLDMLVEATAGYGFMHESFNKDDATDFTRPWFAWANSLFGELVVKIMNEYPEMILKSAVPTVAASGKKIFINRHGEKKWMLGCLNDVGQARASNLATDVYNGVAFPLPDRIFACQYKDPIDCERCKETVTPLSVATGLEIVFDYGYRLVLGGNSGAAKAMLESLDSVDVVVVAWEHNNINKLAKALGVAEEDMESWPDSDYDSIYELTFEEGALVAFEKKAEGFDGAEGTAGGLRGVATY